MTDDDSRRAEPARVNQLDRVKSEYTQAAREIIARSMRGVESANAFGSDVILPS